MMLFGRRALLPHIRSLRLTCLAGAGCLVVAGCMPGEHTSSRSHVEKLAQTESTASKILRGARAPVAAAPSATFAERIDAFAVAPAVDDTFEAALAYAPSPAFGPFGRRGDPFPHGLRDSFDDRTGAIPAASLSRSIAPPSQPRQERPLQVASLGALTPPLPATTAASPTTKPSDIAALVTAIAQKHGVPVPLAHAVVRVESNYKPHVTGRGATLGLMQIKHATARGMGFTGTPKELFDPATNLEWGMRYLAGARRIAKNDLCGTVLRYQGGHYAARMTRAASVYCSKVKSFMAASEPRRTNADARLANGGLGLTGR